MLNQASHWMEILSTCVDAVLLLRILLLRLHRVYLFITLACVLALLFDGATLLLRSDTLAADRVFLYSRFLYAIVFPLTAWDVFEEIKGQITKLRRFAAGRLISGMFFVIIFGLVMGALIDSNDSARDSPVLVTLALVLWAGSSTAAFAFVLTVRRVLKSQPTGIPHNTAIWMTFYELSFGVEAISCMVTVLLPIVNNGWVNDAVRIAFMTFGIVLTGWCVVKLRPIPSGLPSPSENARLG